MPFSRTISSASEAPATMVAIRQFDRPRSSPSGHEHLGYGLCGRVIEVAPDITDISVGELVACSGDRSGASCRGRLRSRNLVTKVPEDVAPGQAAFVTLGSIAMHGLRRTGCRFGETVIVYGLGLLGLLTIQIARSAGVYTIGLDIDHARSNWQALWRQRRARSEGSKNATTTILGLGGFTRRRWRGDQALSTRNRATAQSPFSCAGSGLRSSGSAHSA
ncbi:MAG: hypothetical protein R2845_11030 [Thermomicrobiales bacterium]